MNQWKTCIMRHITSGLSISCSGWCATKLISKSLAVTILHAMIFGKWPVFRAYSLSSALHWIQPSTENKKPHLGYKHCKLSNKRGAAHNLWLKLGIWFLAFDFIPVDVKHHTLKYIEAVSIGQTEALKFENCTNSKVFICVSWVISYSTLLRRAGWFLQDDDIFCQSCAFLLWFFHSSSILLAPLNI